MTFNTASEDLKGVAHPARSNPPEDNQISTGVVGRYTSITIGTDGRGLISYYDAGELMVAHCEDTACISATNNTLDILWEEVYDLGGTSIAIGADGLGLISYTNSFDFFGEETGYNLMVAHCDDTDCTSATTKTLFFSSSEYILSIGAPSITIGSDGLGLISYIVSNHDTFQSSLQVTHCNNTECTSATTRILDSADFSQSSSVTIGGDGFPVISYNKGNRFLNVAHCNDFTCSSATTSTLDSSSDVAGQNSITVGADGLVLISYYKGGKLKVAHCNDIACTSATTSTLDSSGDVAQHNSITVGADGLGLISYYDNTNDDLKVARCQDTVCISATITTVDSAGDVGRYNSITVGTDGLPLISYQLKVAHCSNPFCVPFFRRR